MNEKTIRDAHAIFCEVFHSDMSYEAFRHKHMDNPNIDQDVAILVDYQEGVPAGTNSFMGCMLLLDGEHELPAVYSCDTAVRPAFRGPRVFLPMLQHAISACRETPSALIYATPNQNSYHGFVRLGFHELGGLNRYDCILRPIHLFTRKLAHRAPALPLFHPIIQANRGWTLSLHCPFTEEDLALINRRPGVRLQRSLEFYQWKIDWLPEGEGAYLCARKDGQLEAFLILRRYPNGSCEVCDWMLPENKASSRRLLKNAQRLLRPYCDMLSVNMVNPTGEEPALLESGGFFQRNVPLQPFLICPTADLDEKTLAQLKDLRNWSLRYIDGDTVLI